MVRFNEQQQKAIDFYKGACAVIAGAGSGKSTVLVNRIKNLINIHNVAQDDILAISFTNNTAYDLKKKLKQMRFINVNVGTFHAICRKILEEEGLLFGRSMVPRYKAEQSLKNTDSDEKLDYDEIFNYISFQKNYNKTYKDEFVYKNNKYDESELRGYFKDYELYKKKNNYFDYDDWLMECYEVLKKNPGKYTYDYILVDEHQDSNLVQNGILAELCVSGNMFCVFDYRQAIYSFRGGDTAYCMNFQEEWKDATVINLDTNYRSSKNIVSNANNFIRKYYGDYEHYSDSNSKSDIDGNIKVNSYYDREQESLEIVDIIEKQINDGESLNEIAVLFRLNSHAAHLECELKKREIPYETTNGGSFFKRKEIVGVISYLRLINNPHDDIAFENMFNFRNFPLEFFSKAVFMDVKKHAGMYNKSYYEAFVDMQFKQPWQTKRAIEFENMLDKLRLQQLKGITVNQLIDNVIKTFNLKEYVEINYTNQDDIEDRLETLETLKSFVKHNNLEQFIAFTYDTNKPKSNKNKETVKLMSIHASKGLEFKHVYVIGIQDCKFPHVKSDLLEEARLFYVAVTRPKNCLFLSQIGEGNQFIEEYKIG